MNLVLVVAFGVVLWMAIVAVAIALCRAASFADERTDQTAGMTPLARTETPLRHTGLAL